jgi:hypothetical protein
LWRLRDGSRPARGVREIRSSPVVPEKILTSKGALEAERKQVTVLFADLKGSMELLADPGSEEARRSWIPSSST